MNGLYLYFVNKHLLDGRYLDFKFQADSLNSLKVTAETKFQWMDVQTTGWMDGQRYSSILPSNFVSWGY